MKIYLLQDTKHRAYTSYEPVADPEIYLRGSTCIENADIGYIARQHCYITHLYTPKYYHVYVM